MADQDHATQAVAERLGAPTRPRGWPAAMLGSPRTWPQSLRTLADLMLASNQPMFVAWGPERTLLYNDVYAVILADKHPAALGRDFLEVWQEIRADLEPIVARAYAGEPTHMDDIALVMERRGYPEETHFSFSYTPVRDEAGAVAGFFCQCTETTEQVRAAKRLNALLRLDDRLRDVADTAELSFAASELLGNALGAVRVGYGVLDPIAGTIAVERNWAAPGFGSVAGVHHFRDYGSYIEDLRRGEPVPNADVALDPRTAGTLDGFMAIGVRAFLDVPVVERGRTVAMLFVHSATPRLWSAQEVAFVRDVAERTRAAIARRVAERALRESETRTRFALEAGRLGAWDLDLATGGMTMSETCRANFGRAADQEFSYADLRDAVHPDDKERMAAAVERSVATGGDYDIEYRALTPNGDVRWVHIRARPSYAADGAPLRMAGVSLDVTERKVAEDRLRASEEFNRRVLASSDDCIKVLDLDGRLESMSEGGRRALSIGELGPFLGLAWAESFEPDGRGAAHAAVAEARVGRTARFVAALRTQTGELRWWDTVVSPIAGAAGAPEKLLALSRDITELRRSDQALRELNGTLERRVAEALAERKVLADIVEGTDAFVQVVDLEYRFLAINKASADEFERIYGVRPKAGDPMLDLLADRPEHRDAVKAVWSRALAGEEFTQVGEFGDPGRERRSYEMKYNSLRDEGGKRIGAYQFVYDVTERLREQARLRRVEAARREADALYRAYFENTAEALFVVGVQPDGGFTIEDLNPAHQSSIGLPLAEVQGRRIDEVLPPELAEPVLGHYREAIASGGVYQYRESFDLDGRTTFWDTVLVPVRDGRGRIVRLIGSSRDLTPQMAAEEQLRQSQKMEAMGQLTGGVAHDFNNLLTPIIGSLDMLQRRGLGNEREQRLIGGAMQSAERAKTLVQRLLAFARRQPLQPVAVDLAALVNGMAGLIGSTVGPKIDVRVALADDLPPAQADPNQLEMAILNLGVNARDAMPDGGALTIAAARESVRDAHPAKLRRGHYVRLSVSDTGEGMDEATLARAVEPFFSTKGIGKGTGLGLSMVHGLTAQLGGGLTIASSPGEGTTIDLWLPLGHGPIASDEARVDRPTKRQLGQALLVDDEELVRMSTADMLSDLGYEVVEAGSAEEALCILAKGVKPDLVVTDHLMPGMNGAELARELRAVAPGLPILIVSGYAEVDGIAPDLPRLTKPFRNAELAERVAELHAANTRVG